MSKVLLYHHLGLGDHFMCHGIVREYCKKYEKVAIFSLPHNYVSVSFMFRDLKNLTIIQGDDAFAENFILLNASASGTDKCDQIKKVGFEYLNRRSDVSLEEQFYAIAGVDISKKWDSFFVQRDFAQEQALFEKTAPRGDYAFLHEDVERKFLISRKKIDKDLAIYIPDRALTENIFDYCTIIEKAKEIHVIDSSFMFLIDLLTYENPSQKLYIHRYARENAVWLLPILKKKWGVLTK